MEGYLDIGNCWFVFASNGHYGVVLAWCDDLVPVMVGGSNSLHVDDLLNYQDGKNRPQEPGIYVWEGEYGYRNSFGTGVPEPECDEWFSGTIRKATPLEAVKLKPKSAWSTGELVTHRV